SPLTRRGKTMALHLARPFLPAGLPPPARRRARARAHPLSPTADARPPSFRRPYTSVLVVPTGVGAAVGGFAGDALPVARALAAVADCVISHPNVLNAAMLYWPTPNTLYVEGYALDRFAEGAWALQPVHQNKVGRLGVGLRDRGGAPAPPFAGRGCGEGFARPPCCGVRCHGCSFRDQDLVRSEVWEINRECRELRFPVKSGRRASEPGRRECCGCCRALPRRRP
uniref:DUF3326 domain-containing protein n=2 Tax=Aegilops tauschii subsp. strangulata TaxID=200361 RepID=A0A453DSR3_AEGTS